MGLIFYFEQRKQIKTYHLLMLFYGFVAVLSYTAGSFESQTETLLLCDRLYTLGMLMSIMYMVFSAADLCMYPMRMLEKNILTSLIALIYMVKWDPFGLYLYYFNAKIAERNGFHYIVYEYGPAFYCVILFVVTCFYRIFRIILNALKTKRQVSTKTCAFLIGITSLVCLCYLLTVLTGTPYNLVPLILPIVQIMLFLLFRYISLHDMKATFASVFDEKDDLIYLCFDGKKRYMGCSKLCLKFFPHLELLRIDEPVSEGRCPELIPIMRDLDSWIADEQEHIIEVGEFNDLSFSCKALTIMVHGRIIGILVELFDITKTQQEKQFLDLSNQLLGAELEIQTEKIQKIQGSIITGMARMVESRDNSTGGHINRTSAGVRCFIEYIADNYAFPWCTEQFCKNIIEAAPLHDLGKVAVNDVILRKKGKFTEEEFAEMKKHAGEGAKIVPVVLEEVENLEFKKIAENVAHYHHEKWNGTGYPEGLKGEEIPVEARIMSLADVFDALVSRRCYKDAFSYDSAFDIIRDSLGTQFDPELGKIFLECREQMEALYNTFDLQ